MTTMTTPARRAVPWTTTGLLLAVTLAGPLAGQERPTSLTLPEAIELARSNNPTYLSTANDRSSASWQEREAYGAFIPSVTANGSMGYQEAGVQRIGTLVFDDQVTDWAYSNYNLNLNWTLSGNTIFGISNARANKRATSARIDAASFNLESTVAFQYMAALRASDQLDVAQRQLERAGQNLRIVTTRVSTGAAAGTDGKQAEVDLGRAEVGLIQAERDLRQAKLLLAEQLGVELADDVDLASAFEVFEPSYDVGQLREWALTSHPSLNSFRAQESASRAQARQTVTSQYLPTVNISTGFRGNTLQALNQTFVAQGAEDQAAGRMANCEFNNALNARLTSPLPGFEQQNCASLALTEEQRLAAINSNEVFPFNFTKLPVALTMTVSIPIFTGFSRERQVAQANNFAEDAEHSRRAEELRLRTAVTNMYDNLGSAYRVVQAESRNRALAEEQLQLQQRRYALGASGLLELMDAQTTLSTADQAYLNAVYDFHYSLIALEAAVGRPLHSR